MARKTTLEELLAMSDQNVTLPGIGANYTQYGRPGQEYNSGPMVVPQETFQSPEMVDQNDALQAILLGKSLEPKPGIDPQLAAIIYAAAGLKPPTGPVSPQNASLATKIPGMTPQPPEQTGAPEIINEGGREFMVRRDAKGKVSYVPLAPTVDQKPPSAETTKVGNLATSGLRAVQKIKDIVSDPANQKKFFKPADIAGGFGGEFLATLSGDTQAQIMVDQISELSDVMSRLRSGAAITVSEERRYGKLLNGRFKTKEAYASAIKTVEDFLSGVEKDITTGRRKVVESTSAPAATGRVTTSDEAAGRPPLAPGKVRMVLGGKIRDISAKDVDAALAEGYARYEGK